jgi:hypothetical protein
MSCGRSIANDDSDTNRVGVVDPIWLVAFDDRVSAPQGIAIREPRKDSSRARWQLL